MAETIVKLHSDPLEGFIPILDYNHAGVSLTTFVRHMDAGSAIVNLRFTGGRLVNIQVGFLPSSGGAVELARTADLGLAEQDSLVQREVLDWASELVSAHLTDRAPPAPPTGFEPAT